VQAADPFVADETRVSQLGITRARAGILGLIAVGLSNREIASRLFVSENTVKTHSSRLFDKLGAKRRTQAVQIGKTTRLIHDASAPPERVIFRSPMQNHPKG